MINHNDFNRMWIVVPAGLRQHLTDGKVLTCSHEQVQFVLALSSDLAAAVARRDELAAADPRPAYILPVGPVEFHALSTGESVKVPVLDLVGRRIGEMRLTGGRVDKLRTEQGPMDVESRLLSDLRAGDFFAIAERNAFREWVVYRALADADGNSVHAQRTASGNRTELEFEGVDQVVYFLTGGAMLQKWLRMADVPAAS